MATDKGPRINGTITFLPPPWNVRTLADALAGEDEPPKWIIDQLLHEQSGTLISGKPHGGKSLNWLAAAMGAVIEHKVWGHFEAREVKRVLYIETEDPESLVKRRIRGLAKGFGIPPAEIPDG